MAFYSLPLLPQCTTTTTTTTGPLWDGIDCNFTNVFEMTFGHFGQIWHGVISYCVHAIVIGVVRRRVVGVGYRRTAEGRKKEKGVGAGLE